MTNEDKIHALKLIKLKIEPPTANRLGWLETWIHKEDLEAFDSAIKALEQESIFDKIYADIQRLRGCSCSCSDGIIDDVEDILDKYKAEIEDKE